MWSEVEQQRLKDLHIESARHDREKLTSLVVHFQEGGTIFGPAFKGVPVNASQVFARKVRGLTQAGNELLAK